ncbi:hypothetical protein BDY21DRAFT_369989 [Lineolata rhizophorae]|uniref:Glycoprotease family protein n=1 Tax=Lineolata rhizophorae TaxID=578093 RepID=A0A6A6P7W3_9PEZI|nr:hypothetical protein BDY21DRAFT_369989 [Lineolata rhizophorae]
MSIPDSVPPSYESATAPTPATSQNLDSHNALQEWVNNTTGNGAAGATSSGVGGLSSARVAARAAMAKQSASQRRSTHHKPYSLGSAIRQKSLRKGHRARALGSKAGITVDTSVSRHRGGVPKLMFPGSAGTGSPVKLMGAAEKAGFVSLRDLEDGSGNRGGAGGGKWWQVGKPKRKGSAGWKGTRQENGSMPQGDGALENMGDGSGQFRGFKSKTLRAHAIEPTIPDSPTLPGVAGGASKIGSLYPPTGAQPPSPLRKESTSGNTGNTGLSPDRFSLIDVSPSDRPITIGLSIPSEDFSAHARQFDGESGLTPHSGAAGGMTTMDETGRARSDSNTKTPTIVITPATESTEWWDQPEQTLHRPRPTSSIYSRATFQLSSDSAPDYNDVPPVPAIPANHTGEPQRQQEQLRLEGVSQQEQEHEKQERQSRRNTDPFALQSLTNEIAKFKAQQAGAHDSLVTTFEEDNSPEYDKSNYRRTRHASDCTFFEEDGSPQDGFPATPRSRSNSAKESPTTDLAIDTNIPTPRRSRGWWNLITTPFESSTRASFWLGGSSKGSPDSGTPGVPQLPDSSSFSFLKGSPKLCQQVSPPMSPQEKQQQYGGPISPTNKDAVSPGDLPTPDRPFTTDKQIHSDFGAKGNGFDFFESEYRSPAHTIWEEQENEKYFLRPQDNNLPRESWPLSSSARSVSPIEREVPIYLGGGDEERDQRHPRDINGSSSQYVSYSIHGQGNGTKTAPLPPRDSRALIGSSPTDSEIISPLSRDSYASPVLGQASIGTVLAPRSVSRSDVSRSTTPGPTPQLESRAQAKSQPQSEENMPNIVIIANPQEDMRDIELAENPRATRPEISLSQLEAHARNLHVSQGTPNRSHDGPRAFPAPVPPAYTHDRAFAPPYASRPSRNIDAELSRSTAPNHSRRSTTAFPPPPRKPEDHSSEESRIDEKKRKKKKRLCCCGICGIALVGVALVLSLSLTLTHKGGGDNDDSTGGAQWLNLTDYPPIPTGISVVARPDLTESESGCVAPSTLWSCAVPKEMQEDIQPNSPDQPNFKFEIRYENDSSDEVSLQMTTGQNERRGLSPITLAKSVVSKGKLMAREAWMTLASKADPPAPSEEEMRFLGNTTDGIVVPFEGEDTPFYVTFLPTTEDGDEEANLAKRQANDDDDSTSTSRPTATSASATSSRASRTSATPTSASTTRTETPFPSIGDLIPSPSTAPDGRAAPANLLPFPSFQPLRLYNRGRPDEHYGFYTYFDRSIFLKSAALLSGNETDSVPEGQLPADEVGGAARDAAEVRCTWAQTRFRVQIWTRDAGSRPLLAPIPGDEGSGGDPDFQRPGGFAYPVTIALDRHGGGLNQKMVYCYALDERGRPVPDAKKFQLEDRSFGGVAVNPAQGPFGNVSVGLDEGGPGGIDGGTGGCGREHENVRYGEFGTALYYMGQHFTSRCTTLVVAECFYRLVDIAVEGRYLRSSSEDSVIVEKDKTQLLAPR